MSTLIKNGTIVTADRTYKADVLIEDGKIKAVGPNLKGDTTIDAAGCYVMPGGIDPHTHMDMPFMGTTTADDFESGTQAGLAGGTVGTLSVSRTLFSFRIGARGRISGFLVGALCLFPLALGPSALGFVPMPILGAVLIQLGGSMLYEWLFKSWRLMQPADYLQLCIIFLTIISFDFEIGRAHV